MITPTPTSCDESYVVLENMVRDRVAEHDQPLFTTSVDPLALWGAYLGNLPEERRKHYDCRACMRFLQTYGGLVTIDADGTLRSLLWHGPEEVPPFFAASVRTLQGVVAASRMTGVFLSGDAKWGSFVTRDKKKGVDWSHLSGENPRVFRHPLLSASQAMAEKVEDRKMLAHALADYPKAVVEEAVRVLRADALTRPEKALGVAEWFLKRHGEDSNQLWLAVATAPPGYCHVRSTVISTLLDDVKAGLGFEAVSRRWNEKMHPLQYRRPTAPPSMGQVEAAEKTVEKLGVARSLLRRFAELDDVQVKLWQPRPAEPPKTENGGVFGHLKPGNAVKALELPPQRVTWEKFQRTALGEARSLEVLCPPNGAYYGLVTAEDASAPPILQWDREGLRNPVSWYFYNGGSTPARWGLTSGWQPVTAVFESPHRWHSDQFKHHGRHVFFAVRGAVDQRDGGRGLALFPENLKSELHGIRSVVEAHSRTGKISGAGSANGLAFSGSGSGQREVSVRVDGSATYAIDRWD